MITVHHTGAFLVELFVVRHTLVRRLEKQSSRDSGPSDTVQRGRDPVGIDELRACVSGEHVDHGHLSPLIDIRQQTAQTSIILMDQIDPFGTDMFEGLHRTAIDQLNGTHCSPPGRTLISLTIVLSANNFAMIRIISSFNSGSNLESQRAKRLIFRSLEIPRITRRVWQWRSQLSCAHRVTCRSQLLE